MDNLKLDKGRILALKNTRHRMSHCDQCDRTVSPLRGRISVPAPGLVRCETCTLSAPDEAPTSRLLRISDPPPPAGRRAS